MTAHQVARSSCVYVVRAGSLGHVKIGFCGSLLGVRRRIGQVQTGMSEALQIVAVIVGDRELERIFHDRFATRRLHGEWFDDADGRVSAAALRSRRGVDVYALDLADTVNARQRLERRLNAIQQEVWQMQTDEDRILRDIEVLLEQGVVA